MGTTAPVTAGTVEWGTPTARWTLTATVLGSGMAFLDSTVVTVALPAIGDDLGAGLSGLQWVVNGYMITLSALILLSGSLSDRFGRVRLFMAGVAVFALASVLCTFAPTLEWLVAGRVVQGLGGAMLTPGSLAILQAGFREQDRARAIGAWSGLTGVAGAVGPFVGGWLVQIGDWRLIFLVNVPMAAAVLLIAWFKVPESRDSGADQGLDYTGALLGVLALGGITYALIQWGAAGTTPAVVAAAVVGVLSLAAFVLAEARGRHPMLPLGIFSSASFTVTNAATVLVYGALGPMLFLLVIFLQEVGGYSPVAAGAASLPITALMLLLSARSGKLAARIGPRPQLVAGPLLLAGGFLLLSRLEPEAPYLTGVLPGVLLIALGLASAVAPLTATVLASAPERHAGLASGVNNTFARSAQLIGVAAVPVAAGISGGGQGADGSASAAAIAQGFGPAMLILAGMCALAAVCALALPRRSALLAERRMEEEQGQEDGRSSPEASEPEPPTPPSRFCGATEPPWQSCPGSSAGAGHDAPGGAR
ncbi:DHA2 family efflux MFS transporter permease subunit [Nocardiopsis sp. NRRL B-16309]|uniref:DHA2 family efflux MFS transporter permease subunit n=1 Tax=Nocardiopsis sp. NRRL B-16309 TaxID=1519494 RepID=UPI0006AE7A83|nr:DHA2 family efflux MFS transporter permease subunit [Nocardiopsis sp. NRRL B-16309]